MMRDGVSLSADLYVPARVGKPADGKFPTILFRTLFDKEDAGRSIDTDLFVKRGYAVVLQDCRGRYKSEGSWHHGINEVNDGFDTIEWIAKQPWSDGRVGMTGTSYQAAVQNAAAMSGTPHLVSLFHVKSPTDYYQDVDRGGGACRMSFSMITFYFATSSPEALRDPVLMKSFEDAYEKTPEWLARWPFKKGLTPLSKVPNLETWLLDRIEHTDYDEWWKSVRLWQSVEHLDEFADISGYYVGGWYDVCAESKWYAPLAKRLSKPIKMLMGPWTHMDFERHSGDVDFGPDAEITHERYMELQLGWFDQTLKGRDTGILAQPPVRIFVMGGGSGRKTPEGRLDHGGRWRYENEWPLARTKDTKYHLRSGSGLSTDAPGSDEAPETYLYDPMNPVPTIGGTSFFAQSGRGFPEEASSSSRFRSASRSFVPIGPHDQRERPDVFGCKTNLPLSSRPDVLVFQTTPLTGDVEVTGSPTVKLWGSSTAVDTDFTAKLIDVNPPNRDYPDGYAMNLVDYIIRGHYRNGFEKVELMKPGEAYEFTIPLPATSNLFTRGHSIRLDISSSNYPEFDPNPNTGDRYVIGGNTVVARNTVYHGGAHPSYILLPIIPKT